MNSCGADLIAYSSILAITISQNLNADEIGTLAAFFSSLGDNLAIMALKKT